MYRPAIISATPIGHYRFGSYEAMLFSDIVASGAVRYIFMLMVRPEGGSEPCFYVSLEVNNSAAVAERQTGVAQQPDTAEHYLCVFDQAGHGNLGLTATLNTADAFAARALEVAQERLK